MVINNYTAQRLNDILDIILPVRVVTTNRFGLRALKDLQGSDRVEGYVIMRDGGIVLVPPHLATKAEIELSNRMLETWRGLADGGSLVHLDLMSILIGF